MGYIVDISKWQDPSKIDYDTFCKQLDMAIIRVQYGSLKIDPCYTQHIAEMQKHKVPYGVYAFVRGISIADMAQEARDFYCRAKDYNPAFYALDVEEQSMEDMRSGINAYIAELRKYTGNKKIGIYVAHNRYEIFNLDLSKADFVWLPHYGVNNGQISSTPAYYCDLHQYTSVGRISGYEDNLDLDRLMNGRTIEFFTGTKAAPKPITPPPAPKQQPKPAESTTPDIYIAQAGDTLSGIAARFNISGGYKTLAEINNIANPDIIKVGQHIRLKAAYNPPADINIYYTVKPGDTLSGIAAKYHVNGGYKELARINQIPDPNKIYTGQKIKIDNIPVHDTSAPAFYTVRAGDVLSRIAARYKTTVNNLMKLNSDIKDPNKIYIGQKIKIK
ncbi:MAG: LysM peptidoglycan-binding domain-containing protein [Clostridiales bacterium]|nr:LysM peptidoglycan-binding domain-containing protein [Clostridiales bacterium]